MKKLTLLLALLVCGMVPSLSFADTATVNTPKNELGQEVHPYYGGYKYRRITGTTEILVCSGYCLIGSIFINTGPATSVFRLRDSSTADGTPDHALTVLNVPFNVIDTSPSFRKVDLNIRTTSGIVGKLNAASTNEQVTVTYIPLGPNN